LNNYRFAKFRTFAEPAKGKKKGAANATPSDQLTKNPNYDLINLIFKKADQNKPASDHFMLQRYTTFFKQANIC